MDDWTDWMLFRRVHHDITKRTTSTKYNCPFYRMVQHRHVYVERSIQALQSFFQPPKPK
jgi:hypothetical protein